MDIDNIDLNQSSEYYIDLLDQMDRFEFIEPGLKLAKKVTNKEAAIDIIVYIKRMVSLFNNFGNEKSSEFLKLPRKQKLFYKAIDKNQIEKVAKFIENGIDIDYLQCGVLPAIFRAVYNLNLEIIDLLIHKGNVKLNHAFHTYL